MIKKLLISSAAAVTLVFSTLSSAMDHELELGRDEATANQQKLFEPCKVATPDQLGHFSKFPFEVFKKIMDEVCPLKDRLKSVVYSQNRFVLTQNTVFVNARAVNSFFEKYFNSLPEKYFHLLPVKADLDASPEFFNGFKDKKFEFWGSYVTSAIWYTDEALSVASKIGASFPNTNSIDLCAQLLTQNFSQQMAAFFPHLESLHASGYFLDHEYDNDHHYDMEKIAPILEVGGLKSLTLDHNRIGESGVRYLSTLSSLSKLEYLSLKNCMIRKSKYSSHDFFISSLKELIESPHMQQLKILDLRNFKLESFTKQYVGKKTANELDVTIINELAKSAQERGLTILY